MHGSCVCENHVGTWCWTSGDSDSRTRTVFPQSICSFSVLRPRRFCHVGYVCELTCSRANWSIHCRSTYRWAWPKWQGHRSHSVRTYAGASLKGQQLRWADAEMGELNNSVENIVAGRSGHIEKTKKTEKWAPRLCREADEFSGMCAFFPTQCHVTTNKQTHEQKRHKNMRKWLKFQTKMI